MKKLNVNSIIKDSIVDGPGVRTVIFFQGCTHACVGCHNPETWDFISKNLMTIEEIVEQVQVDNFSKKITLSGGDPMQQNILPLVQLLKAQGFNIWLYTGYELEELNSQQIQVLEYIDTIVTGRFKQELRDLSLQFCGSTNQKIINLE